MKPDRMIDVVSFLVWSAVIVLVAMALARIMVSWGNFVKIAP